MDLSLIIDLALIVIVVTFAIVGLIKGFFKSFLSFFGTIVSIIIAILLTKQVANLLIGIGPVNSLFGSEGIISNAIEKGLVKLSPEMFSTIFSAESNKAELAAALTSAGIPSFLSPTLAGVVSQFNFAAQELTLAQIIAPMLANIIFLVTVALLLFTLLKIILAILNKFFKFLTKNRAISGLNRLFGFIVGALKGAVAAAAVLIIISLFPHSGFLAPFNESLDKTVIAKPFNSFVYNSVGKHIDLDKIISGLFPGAKKMSDKEAALYSELNIDFTAEGQSPESFAAVNDNAKKAMKHFADYNSTVLSNIGGNNLVNDKMDGYITTASSIRANYSELFGKLNNYNGLTESGEDTAAVTAEIETLLKQIDSLYAGLNEFAAYSVFFTE